MISCHRLAWQEDEARFRPGTNKWVAFKVLREAGAGGLSVPQIMARSKQAGLKQWDDNAKRIIQFVRSALCARLGPPWESAGNGGFFSMLLSSLFSLVSSVLCWT